MKDKFVITIGRQLGSGGKKLGEILSQKLNIPCYDKELILMASRKSGLGAEFFEQADEKSRFSLFCGLFGFRSGYIGDNSNNYLCNERLFEIQSDVIKQLAEKESCIFVGRCADYILRNNPRCINIFIHADLDDRVQTLMNNNNRTRKEALNLIEQTDKKRAGYYNYYSNKTWGMAMSYDLCINSSLLGIEETALFVQKFVEKRLDSIDLHTS